MTNADRPRSHPDRERLLWVETGTGAFSDGTLGDLPDHLRACDLLVMNDAATLPASLPVRVRGQERDLELRLAGHGGDATTWWAVLFGPGDWRIPTEHRHAPPRVEVGERLQVGSIPASVLELSPLSPRLLRIRFEVGGEDLYRELYRVGRPVQYSYLREDLRLWDVQTRYGARPWAFEMPSAGRPLTWDTLARLQAKGVAVATLTHAAGLSATGDPGLDAALPLPERYDLPARTVDAIATTRTKGGRVIAVGTSVVRALEGNAGQNGGRLRAGSGTVDLVLGPDHDLRVVDGLLTGIHDPGTSHFALMEAFVPRRHLEPALCYAEAHGFLQHEFGDSMLLLPRESSVERCLHTPGRVNIFQSCSSLSPSVSRAHATAIEPIHPQRCFRGSASRLPRCRSRLRERCGVTREARE